MFRSILGLSLSLFLVSSPLTALIFLDEVMSKEEQRKIGLDELSHRQRRALEEWLNDNVLLKTAREKQIHSQNDVYVTEIINQGQQIRLSDNSLYEIAPEDWAKATSWIIAATVKVTPTEDSYYPWKITNPISGLSVNARLIEKPISPEPQR